MLGRVLKKRCTRELLRHGRATRQPSAAAPKVPSANHSLRSGTRRFTQRNPGGGGRPGEGARRARRSLQRSLEQPQADAHAALGYTDVLRHQLDAAASERAYYPCPCLRLVCWVCVLCQLTFTKKMKRQPCVVVAVLCVLRCLCFNFLYE